MQTENSSYVNSVSILENLLAKQEYSLCLVTNVPLATNMKQNNPFVNIR